MKARQGYRKFGQWAKRIWRLLFLARSGGARRQREAAAADSGDEVMWAQGPLGPAEAKLMEELQSAHREWACARHRLNFALDADEIDYAIYALETAEKRYGMLIKQAKMMQLRVPLALRSPFRTYEPVDRW